MKRLFMYSVGFISRTAKFGVRKNQIQWTNTMITVRKLTFERYFIRVHYWPYFFNEPIIKCQNYLKMLKEFFHPVLARKRIVKRIYFQQGALFDWRERLFRREVARMADWKKKSYWVGRSVTTNRPQSLQDIESVDISYQLISCCNCMWPKEFHILT